MKGDNVHWTKAQLVAAIDRCEKDVVRIIERHATPEEIEKRRKGIDMLWKWMDSAED